LSVKTVTVRPGSELGKQNLGDVFAANLAPKLVCQRWSPVSIPAIGVDMEIDAHLAQISAPDLVRVRRFRTGTGPAH
jgi:hypothetical protein